MCSWFTGTRTYDWGGLISREGGRGGLKAVWYANFVYAQYFLQVHSHSSIEKLTSKLI